MTDESAQERILVAQQQKAEECNQPKALGLSRPLSATSEHDMWSDFILPEHLFTSEASPSCAFQDFPSLLKPKSSSPDILASPSADILSLSSFAGEDITGSNIVDIAGPPIFETGDTFCQETEITGTASTDSTLSAQLSNGWDLYPDPSVRSTSTDMMTQGPAFATDLMHPLL